MGVPHIPSSYINKTHGNFMLYIKIFGKFMGYLLTKILLVSLRIELFSAILCFPLRKTYGSNHKMLNDLNKVPKPIVSEDMREQIERGLIHSMQNKEEILISYYRDGIVHDMYINVSHIEPMIKTVYCTDAFGLDTEFKFDELVSIN
ncbi:YolD-like family protein [Bacillus sp. NA_146.1]